MKYVHFVVPEDLPVKIKRSKYFPVSWNILFASQAEKVVDDCKSNTYYDEDLCDYVYQAYKCFWDYVKAHNTTQAEAQNETQTQGEVPKQIPFSLYHKLGFELLDQEEEEVT